MELTLAERLQLRNQLQIMKALKVPDHTPDQYDEMIEIVEGGYSIFYSELLGGMNAEGTSEDVASEVLEILDLYRALDTAKSNGLVLPTSGYPSFAGFDANNDDHYGFSVFVLDTQGKYAESAPARNSHTRSTLDVYRRMVSAWQSRGRNFSLTQADVDAIFA